MLATVRLGLDGMPHGYCFLWNPSLIWLHTVSDGLIAAAYFTIPLTLVYFVRKRRDLPFNWMFVCFGVFILACGTTHLLSIYTIWVPAWWLSGGVKVLTAAASVPTAVLLYRLVPDAVALPSPSDLAEANAALREAHDALERRVAERTAELAAANRELARSRERYRSLVEATAQIVWHTDAAGTFGGEQPGWSRFTGQTTAQLEDRGSAEVVHPEDRDRMDAVWRRGILAGKAFETACRIRRRDGEYRHMAVRAVPVRDDSGGVREWVGTHTDITEQVEVEEQLRRTESQLLQAQRMEAVGRLAGGVAHDFNNILTVITSASQVLLETLPANSEAHADVVDIEQAAKRAAYLTRQLLAFSRRQVLQMQVLSLNAIVEDIETILRRVIGGDVELHTRLSADLGTVRADPGQIEQVIMNLAVNARDAMPDGGHLTIETANVDIGAEYAGTHLGVEPGAYVALLVSDTGQGMDAMTRAQIFEPFFTTKGPGKGTGLGLSTVYGIVKQCDGTIWVYSEPGKGAAFKIYLPRTEEFAARAAPTPPVSVTDNLHGGEVILLAEDEIGVRVHSARVLRRAGYTVLDAPDGAGALALAQGWSGPIDLLITDMIMPGMGGRSLAERVTERYPSIAILFMSGYTDDDVVRQGGVGAPAFLQKPYTPSSLARKVREVLEASQAARQA